MVSPKIEMRLRARSHAAEQVLGLLEDMMETPDSGSDQQVFQESLQEMEKEAREQAKEHPDEALYYNEQAAFFHEASTWPLE